MGVGLTVAWTDIPLHQRPAADLGIDKSIDAAGCSVSPAGPMPAGHAGRTVLSSHMGAKSRTRSASAEMGRSLYHRRTHRRTLVARLWVLTLSPTQNLKDRNTHGYIEGPREPTLAYQLRKGGGQSRVVPCRFETEDRRSVGENRVSDYSCPVLLHGSATAVAAPARGNGFDAHGVGHLLPVTVLAEAEFGMLAVSTLGAVMAHSGRAIMLVTALLGGEHAAQWAA
jgi:hypothetical protein